MTHPVRIVTGAAGALLLLASMAEATICVVGESIRLRRVEGIVVVEDARSGKPDALLPGVTVELSSGQYHATTVTDADGYFKFSPVRQGNYQIRASLEGFRDAVGEVRVRSQGASEGRVLVMALTLPLVGYCGGGVTTQTFREARLLQQEFGEQGRLRRRRAENQTLRLVDLCELPDSAKEGEVVRLRSIYRSGLEESVLVDKNDCLYGRSFWVGFESDWRGNSRRRDLWQLKRRPSGTDALVIFRGYYECQGDGTGGYGHLDWHVCQFTVLALERFDGAVPAD